MSGLTYIYVLRDPRNGEVRYIGKSVNPRKRLQGHIADARSSRTKGYCGSWIKNLLRHGARPELVLLQAAGRLVWPIAEQWWIAHYRDLGARLTNLAAGGKGGTGRIMPETERLARRPSARRAWQTRRTRYGRAGCSDPVEFARKISLSTRGRTAWNKDRKCPGAGQNLRDYMTQNGPWNKGHKETRAAVIEKLKSSHRGKKQSIETIARRRTSLAITNAMKTSEERSGPVKRSWITRRANDASRRED